MSMLPDKVPIVLVNQPRGGEADKVHFLATNWVMVSPDMPPNKGAMHIKVRNRLRKKTRADVTFSCSWYARG